MIQKLEEELDTKIFDRSQQPVCPTPIGLHIIEQARNVLVQTHRIKNIIEEEKHSLSGIFKLGILPTIAPYLLPRFFPQLMKKYPQLDIRVVEMKTNDIKKALQTGDIDAGKYRYSTNSSTRILRGKTVFSAMKSYGLRT